MTTPAITGTDATTFSANTDEASFNKAVENAQSGEMTPELHEMMVEGAVTIGGQMIIMPRANDILNEAMSDE